ncbi:MAG: hypothetical protein AAF211_13470 [Myxococcota bacterium]
MRLPPDVTFLADGFAVRFPVRAFGLNVGPELTLLYGAMSTAGAFLAADPVIGLALLGPAAGLWWGTRRHHTATLTVTHDRLACEAPLGRRWTVAMRDIREVEVFDRELEVLLWGGQRVRVPAPAPGRDLSWIVGKLRQLRDDAARFALEMAEHRERRPRFKPK